MTSGAIKPSINIDIETVQQSRLSEVDMNNIPFGKTFSDHMMLVEYSEGQWGKPRIVPYGKLSFSPAMSALNYGQAIFEGMKAFRSENDEIVFFRMRDNFKRLNRSARRMAMPELPEEIFVEGIQTLVNLDRKWVPSRQQGSLYLRPVMFATDEMLGVRASSSYLFVLMCSPVGPYYAKPVKLLTTKDYVRASFGGTGAAKAAGNYGAAMMPSETAKQQGFDNLIWLDAREHRYIEEVGTMNIFFVINGEVITPLLGGTILPGITRDSLIAIMRDHDIPVRERRISIFEIENAFEQGTLQEAFGAGTAAGVSDVASIYYGGRDMELPPIEERKVGPWLYQLLSDYRYGAVPDTHGWLTKI
jgi:branched-chain amino acid aminotransferase